MKIHKLESIVKGDDPIIRVTYKIWFGKTKIRDVCVKIGKTYWLYMDNNIPADGRNAINCFYKNNFDVYHVNRPLK